MKITKFAFLVCAMGVLVFTTSCKKNNEQTTTMNVVMGEWEDDDDTRMYIDFDNGVAKWNGNDEVMVYNLKFNNNPRSSVYSVFQTSAAAEGQHSAQFTGPTVGPKKDSYFTFYPAELTEHYEGGTLDEDNREYFTIPETQNFTTYQKLVNGVELTKNTLDPMALVQAAKPASLKNVQFQNIFGTLRIGLVGDDGRVVDHIEIIDNEYNLTGKVSVKLHEADASKLNTLIGYYRANEMTQFASYFQEYVLGELGYNSNYPGHTKMITLDCSANPTQAVLSNNYALEVYFGLRPGALGEGFKVKIYMDNDEAYYMEYPANHNKCIRPGVIRTIRPVYLGEDNYGTEEEEGPYGRRGSWAFVQSL